MLKMIFFDEDPDEVLKEEDISADVNSGVERIDFRDTEEVGTNKGCKGILVRPIITKVIWGHISIARDWLKLKWLISSSCLNQVDSDEPEIEGVWGEVPL